MLEKVVPAVVNISSAQTQVTDNPLLNDPFFRRFFNIPDRKTQSRGSGVVVDATQGYVITNNHVIDNATEITVTLQDGHDLQAKVVGTDPETDVTLLKIPADNLTALPLANSDLLRVGDFVVAIGNPFGLGQTVTSGIVSALGRTGLNIENYEDFIQTDASINPGNSGGALVNLRGELVGINTAIMAPGGGNVGIGFAIPSNMVHQVVQQLVQYGKVQRGTLGITLQPLTTDLAAAFGLDNNKGAVVREIERGSPAQQAGLQPGDVITAINNQPIAKVSDVRNRVGLLRVGDKVAITIIRKGRTLRLTAVLTDSGHLNGEEISEYLAGALLKNTIDGVQVHEISKGSVAWRVGLRQKDMIIGINRQKVANLEDLKQLLARVSLPMTIKLLRNSEIVTILLQ
jgi:Do/DeqQ family serine protease